MNTSKAIRWCVTRRVSGTPSAFVIVILHPHGFYYGVCGDACRCNVASAIVQRPPALCNCVSFSLCLNSLWPFYDFSCSFYIVHLYQKVIHAHVGINFELSDLPFFSKSKCWHAHDLVAYLHYRFMAVMFHVQFGWSKICLWTMNCLHSDSRNITWKYHVLYRSGDDWVILCHTMLYNELVHIYVCMYIYCTKSHVKLQIGLRFFFLVNKNRTTIC